MKIFFGILLLLFYQATFAHPVCGGKPTKDDCLNTKLDAASNTCCWVKLTKDSEFDCKDVIRSTSGYYKQSVEEAGGSIECYSQRIKLFIFTLFFLFFVL